MDRLPIAALGREPASDSQAQSAALCRAPLRRGACLQPV